MYRFWCMFIWSGLNVMTPDGRRNDTWFCVKATFLDVALGTRDVISDLEEPPCNVSACEGLRLKIEKLEKSILLWLLHNNEWHIVEPAVNGTMTSAPWTDSWASSEVVENFQGSRRRSSKNLQDSFKCGGPSLMGFIDTRDVIFSVDRFHGLGWLGSFIHFSVLQQSLHCCWLLIVLFPVLAAPPWKKRRSTSLFEFVVRKKAMSLGGQLRGRLRRLNFLG